MASNAERQAIIDSLFSPDSGGVAEKLLIHVKIFEDVKQSDGNAKNKSAQIIGKPRFLCLTQKRNKIRLYKVKRNQSNGTYTIGKAWTLEDIKQIDVIDANQFSMTLNKTYLWAVERPRDKMTFLAYVVDSAHRFLGKVPRLVNVDESQLLRYMTPSSVVSATSPTSPASASSAPKPQQQQQPQYHSTQPPSLPAHVPVGSLFGDDNDSLTSFSSYQNPPPSNHPPPSPNWNNSQSPSNRSGPPPSPNWNSPPPSSAHSRGRPGPGPAPVADSPPTLPPHATTPPAQPSTLGPQSVQKPKAAPIPQPAPAPVPVSVQPVKPVSVPKPVSTPKPVAVPKPVSLPKPISAAKPVSEEPPMQEPRKQLTPPDNKEKEREDRRERERAREMRRERELRERQALEEKEKLKKMAAMKDKMAEKASLMNVEELLTDFNWKTSGNAAALEKRLLNELHALEAANVHAIIQSDERVRTVVEQIDRALEDLDTMEGWLSLYSAELNSMGDDIREIETQNRGLQILAQNQQNLIRELDLLLGAISIPRSCLDSLKYDPMDTTEDIVRLQASAERLQKVLKVKHDGGMQNMKAVQEQMAMYNVHSNNFSARIFEFLKSQFDSHASQFADQKSRSSPGQSRKAATPQVTPHTPIEDSLIRYQGFLLWEKEMEPRMYSELQRHYAETMAPLYERDIRDLVDGVRPYYTTLRNRSQDDLDYIFKPEESRPVRALAYGANLRSDDGRPNRYRQMLRGSVEGVLGSGGAGRGSIDEDERAADEAFAQAAAQGIMLVCREQNFMGDLFQTSQGSPKSFLERGPVYPQVSNKNEISGRREKAKDVKLSKKIIDLMTVMFESLEPSLVSLLEYGTKSDPTQSVSALASIEFQYDKWKGSDQDFVIQLCQSLMQRLTRMFDHFVTDQLKVIEDTKVSTKKRRGILPFFRTFPLFALRLEIAVSNVDAESDTRRVINDAYEKIINAMMSSLDTIARESDQTGDDKDQLNANIMYIENMHHFHHELRASKLHVLDKWIKRAKSQYDSSLNAYIKVVIRRPLGKLLEFFEGVENLMHTSTAEDVQFHMNYNKAQLRKVISMYQPKEFKKALEQLYKRVDKHFSEEEGLLQVIWRGIQEEFIQQHEKMEDLIQKCYPDAGVHLEFTVQDLLNMMSELARKVHLQ